MVDMSEEEYASAMAEVVAWHAETVETIIFGGVMNLGALGEIIHPFRKHEREQ